MRKKDNEIELVKGKDGIYCERSELRETKTKKKTYENMDQFFEGVDAGLDFLEKVEERAKRFFKLKG